MSGGEKKVSYQKQFVGRGWLKIEIRVPTKKKKKNLHNIFTTLHNKF